VAKIRNCRVFGIQYIIMVIFAREITPFKGDGVKGLKELAPL
jgi:hypothetical protein